MPVALTHLERQQLAHSLLVTFGQKVKPLAEYSSRNSSLIKRAGNLIKSTPAAATSFLNSTGRNASYNVSKSQQNKQRKLALELLLTKKVVEKQKDKGKKAPPGKNYFVSEYEKESFRYKIVTSPYAPFPPGKDVPGIDLTAYYYKDPLAITYYDYYIVDPRKWIDDILTLEATGFNRFTFKMQGISIAVGSAKKFDVTEVEQDGSNLEIKFLGSPYSNRSLALGRGVKLAEKFALVKQIVIKMRGKIDA